LASSRPRKSNSNDDVRQQDDAADSEQQSSKIAREKRLMQHSCRPNQAAQAGIAG
jgi:hypothetical protein